MILALKQVLSQSLQENALVITATRRLAKQWHPILVNSSVSQSPALYAQGDWLKEVWLALEASGQVGQKYLLSSTQESMLWKKIIESSTQGARLLRVHATAKSVAAAFSLLKQWELPLEALGEEVGSCAEETELFLQWAQEFAQLLDSRSWCIGAQLPSLILEHLGNHIEPILQRYSASKKIVLLGFEDIPPQFQNFYSALRKKGWDIVDLQHTLVGGQTQIEHHKYAFYDKAQELQAAACWAKSLKTKVSYPGAIGIVIPDLAECRSQVVQIFTQVLEPLVELQPQEVVSDTFNISVARPLSSYPIIFAALKALGLLKEMHLEEEQHLFFRRSAFFSGVEPDFLKDPKVILFKQSLPAKTTLVYWAEIFNQFLKLLAWPGERVLNSIEHQAMARFQLLLEEYAALEAILETQSLGSALQFLIELANETAFQGQSKPAPIHIMGMLEASSQPFDYLWVSGLHNEAWPPIPKANPFLPIALQRKHHMPHASSEREYMFSKKLLENLKQACQTVVLSYYKSDSSKVYYPSHLIEDLKEETPTFQEIIAPFQRELNITLESIIDNKAPAIIEGTHCRGGTGVFEAQAHCPFKAFAQYRLHIEPKEQLSLGLKGKERGNLVHKIAEQLWVELKTHANLCTLSQEALQHLINQTVHLHIEQVRNEFSELNETFWQVENERLAEIFLKWLTLEKERIPFKVVSQEQQHKCNLAGLRWNFKIDRMDKDENDNFIIIDYKTAPPKLSDCLEPRLLAPQLPLYYINSPFEPKAVAFGELQAQDCKFLGFSALDEILPGIKAEIRWEALIAQWRQSLETLALEFKEGHAEVAPFKGEQTCRNCYALQLCRVKSLNDV